MLVHRNGLVIALGEVVNRDSEADGHEYGVGGRSGGLGVVATIAVAEFESDDVFLALLPVERSRNSYVLSTVLAIGAPKIYVANSAIGNVANLTFYQEVSTILQSRVRLN